jgi:aminoglycoside adenylyltransferase-like protein
MHPEAERKASQYLAIADREFGDRLVGFYLIGSAAMGGFRPRQSDVDFVAVLDQALAGDCERVRKVQRRGLVRVAAHAATRAAPQSGACNGTYIQQSDLTRPVTEIVPIASHVGVFHGCGQGFDVNPVQWQTFLEHGVALRGAPASELGLQPQPELMRQWNLDNLNSYWKRVSEKAATGKSSHTVLTTARWVTAWIVSGPARMHRTLTTGDIVSKEAACEYALEAFDTEWHPIIRDALGHLRRGKPDPAFKDRRVRYETTGRFGLNVIDAANALT